MPFSVDHPLIRSSYQHSFQAHLNKTLSMACATWPTELKDQCHGQSDLGCVLLWTWQGDKFLNYGHRISLDNPIRDFVTNIIVDKTLQNNLPDNLWEISALKYGSDPDRFSQDLIAIARRFTTPLHMRFCYRTLLTDKVLCESVLTRFTSLTLDLAIAYSNFGIHQSVSRSSILIQRWLLMSVSYIPTSICCCQEECEILLIPGTNVKYNHIIQPDSKFMKHLKSIVTKQIHDQTMPYSKETYMDNLDRVLIQDCKAF